VTGAAAVGVAVEDAGQLAVDLDVGGKAFGIELVDRRGEDQVDAGGAGKLEVTGLVARITVEVRVLPYR
jgi:hypothetical protein